MRILAISGSLRARSTNTLLVQATAALAPDGMNVFVYQGLAELPHFNPDLDVEIAPNPVNNWREQIRNADGVLICTPEYAYGLPGSLKNALDWTVSSGEIYNKPVVTISASPNHKGAEKAHASLLLTLGALSAAIPEGGSLTIPLVNTKLDSDGNLVDTNTKDAIRSLLEALARTVLAADKTGSD